MSLVLPTDVEGVLTGRALGRSAIWVSSVFLMSTFILVLASGIAVPQSGVPLALTGLAVAGLAVAWALLVSHPWAVLGLMLVAGLGLFVFAFQVSLDLGPFWRSDSIVFTMPKIAITVVGVAGRSLLASLLRSTIGFVLASAAVQVATRMNGLVFAFDLPSICIWLGIVVLIAMLWYGRSRATRGVGTMQAAAAVEERIAERSRVAAEASAVLRDTVHDDLLALSQSPSGALVDEHRAFLAKDIASLAHPGLLVDEVMNRGIGDAEALEASGLTPIIRSAGNRGLQVVVSGEPRLLLELDPRVRGEILGAADQALSNVSRHAGTLFAEVAVASGRDSINLVVTDSGRGFAARARSGTPGRPELSLRRRIEDVDGTVQVWSTPGHGTSVLMSVPRARCGAGG
ncbi:hypothetical protein B7R22_02800 [Subtercola boreus]|uniref:Histidine kinase/HSP90-like ATPase domain-containing protein n=1 Tax=Subtercola boreus TaxID=120213 RepID=A0A3E0W379_9MICO|nr:hypothetical protein [Subtercola boreus]RFA16431.1 hypothetical protein B7R22_02800 [Subtercola boreus]